MFRNLRAGVRFSRLVAHLFIAFLTVVPLVSCLGGDDETVVYGDTAISSFSLSYLKVIKHVTSSKGEDSTIVVTPTASLYRFDIDHYNKTIVNKDSLPFGTDSLRFLLNIAATNGGYVYYRTGKSDTVTYFQSTDTISFLENPRKFIVISTDAQNAKEYTVKMNIHKEDSMKMTWSAPYDVPMLAGISRSTSVVFGNSLIVKGLKDDKPVLFKTALSDGRNWTQLTPDQELAVASNLAVMDDVVYAVGSDNKTVYMSYDAEKWTPTAIQTDHPVSFYGGNGLYIYGYDTDQKKIVLIDPFFATVEYDKVLNLNNIPVHTDLTPSFCPVMGRGSDAGYLDASVIVGTTDGKCSMVLYKAESIEEQKWMELTNEDEALLPDGVKMQAVAYGDYLVTLANNCFFTSLDRGRTWYDRYYMHTPAGLQTGAEFVFAADPKGTLWIITENGQVYRGKLNRMAWGK
ncbi:MAG: hypothetical protein HUK08_07345 [Bacteroidaceae bacterium]|nr:hypothetical protein [Bacteroidaceae bacterium]